MSVKNNFIDTRVSHETKKNKKREYKNRKVFNLKAMEALTDKISFLRNKYEILSINAQEKLGYHYNEILNILLFYKYVKSDKKLFKIYLKIKNAINKGYNFLEKNKKIKKENLNMENKTHFAINKKTNKILESWNYFGYDINELKKYKDEYFTKKLKKIYPNINESDVTVLTKDSLTKKDINPNMKDNWEKYNFTHFAIQNSDNKILFGFNYEGLSQEELNKNKVNYFINVLKQVYPDINPSEIKIVKSDKLPVSEPLNESNWVGFINENIDIKYFINENKKQINPEKITNMVNSINELIGQAYDSDGEPIYVLDKNSTLEESIAYEPIEYSNNKLIIKYKNEFGKTYSEIIKSDDIETEGIDTLKHIYKLYKLALKNITESTSMGSAFPAGGEPTGGYPVANPKHRPKKGFDLSPNQDMHKAKNMLPSVKNALKSFQKFSKKKNTSETGIVDPVRTTHYAGTKKSVNENYNLIDLDELLNDNIIYRKIDNNPFKSKPLELLRENNRDSIIEFLLEHQGTLLPEVYNQRQLNGMSLRTLNDYYKKLVQRLHLNEEKKPDALLNLNKIHAENKKNATTYFKKDASQKTTSLLVDKGEGDGLKYDSDSLNMKDIPKFEKQSEHQKQYLEVIHRGLEDVVPENMPDGKPNQKWEDRKKELAGEKVYNDAKKRIKAKKDFKIGTNRAMLAQKDLPKVPNDMSLIKENNIIDQIQSFYKDDKNQRKPVIFNVNDIIILENKKHTKNFKELDYKCLGQKLSEDFLNLVNNRKLLYSTTDKKVYLV
jgi:hypothetical protein